MMGTMTTGTVTTMTATTRTTEPRRSSPGRCVVPVARTAHGGDRRRFAELAAQVPDVDVHDVGRRIGVVLPDGEQDLRAAQHLARMAQEVLEQGELPVRQLDDPV